MILTKLLGAGCIVLGFIMVVYFPDATSIQPSSMGWAGVLIGIFLIILGIYLLKLWSPLPRSNCEEGNEDETTRAET